MYHDASGCDESYLNEENLKFFMAFTFFKVGNTAARTHCERSLENPTTVDQSYSGLLTLSARFFHLTFDLSSPYFGFTHIYIHTSVLLFLKYITLLLNMTSFPGSTR